VASFQRELARTHAWYLERGVALIRQHHPATHGVPAVVDRGGKVIRPGTLHFEAAAAPCDFGGIAAVAGKVRGILFDAKVITGTATYAHAEAQYHQLEELRDQQRLKGIGFLLLADQELGIAYLVQELAPLLARESIVLRDTPKLGSKKVALEAMAHRYPCVRSAPTGLLRLTPFPRQR
jgi:penicillin-binding protein-related factor A (putative recombinase)